MAKKQHLDEFLREKLDQLPNASVAGFDKVEGKMFAKNRRGILLLMLVPLLLAGLYWVSSFNEGDLYPTLPGQYENQEVLTKDNFPIATDDFDESEENQTTHNKADVLEASFKLPAPVVLNSSALDMPEPDLGLVDNSSRGEPTTLSSPQIEVQYVEAVVSDVPLSGHDVDGFSEAQLAPNNSISAASQSSANWDLIKNSVGSALTSQHEEVAAINHEFLTPKFSPWSVTLNVYPNYTFREFKIKDGYQDKVNERYETIVNESEKGGFAFNVGLDVRYQISNDVFIGSGLGFIQTKITGEYNFDIYGSPNIDQLGAIQEFKYFAKPININRGIIQTYRFLQVPLHVSYQPWASDRIRLIVEGGFSYIHFMGAEGTTIDYQTLAPKDLSTESFNNNLASIDFKIGATYYVSESIGIGLEPNLMYFSGSIYPSDHPVAVVPWSVGVNVNLRLRLY